MLKRLAYLLMIMSMITNARAAQMLDHVVAQVNDGVITSSELDSQVDALRQQIVAKSMQVPSDTVLRKQVLQHLIDVDIQLQLAKQNDIKIDDYELDDAIKKIADQNKLTLDALREAVVQQGLTWKVYRENIRKEMLLGRLQQKAVSKEINVTAEQVEDYLKVAGTQDTSKLTYHLQNIVVPLSEEPTTEELKNALEKSKQILSKIKQGGDFSSIAIAESSGTFALEGGDLGERHLAELPDIFAKQVTQMHVGQVSGPIRTGNGYQLIKLIAIGGDDQKREVTKTHVRHILLRPDASNTAEEARQRANNIYQQLKSGKDFAVMAKQYSLDVTSAIKGGDLGWVSPGDLVAEFEKTMDALPVHVVSKPVKSVFGWHIIEVLARKKVDDSESFKRQQVRQYLQQKKFTEAVQNWQQHLRAQAYIKVIDKELA